MNRPNFERRTIQLRHPPSVLSWGNIGGKMEAQGPLAAHFDTLSEDSFFGEKTWEQAESKMQKTSLKTALQKGSKPLESLDFLLAGDLLNQCTASAFAHRDSGLPYLGLYSACATMGEALGLGALLIDSGAAHTVGAVTSSHYCTAERQYRTPLPYGSQRTPTAQWTATAAGCCLLCRKGFGPFVTHITFGKIVDWGIADTTNMGAAMAPAAYDTLRTHFAATGDKPEHYDLILTGDLGSLGHEIVCDFFKADGVHLGRRYQDCGMLLYDAQGQDMHAGGSGAGCSAAVLCGYILDGMRSGKWRRVLFAPTGALLSPASSMQGQSIPGICHAVVFSMEKEG